MQGYKIFCTHITPGGACNVNTVITDNIVTSSIFFPSSPKYKLHGYVQLSLIFIIYK